MPIENLTPLIMVMNDEYWLPYVLKSVSGWFNNYVIYDVGSQDKTPEIIDWFIDNERRRANIFYRKLPSNLLPEVQGPYRNSMIAEARTDWYFILDGDEVYKQEDLQRLRDRFPDLQHEYEESGGDVIYGVIRRLEINNDLRTCFGLKRSHHRLYHRTAVFTGPHPGESPLIKQNKDTEYWLDDITCYHFHGAARSSVDYKVPKRYERKNRKTYTPGNIIDIDLLQELPILRYRINDFPVAKELQELQDKLLC